MKWIDATLPFAHDTVHWPGHPQYTVTDMMSMEEGEVMNVTSVSFCSHFGTHIDAPKHYIKDGKSVDDLPVDVFIGPCLVVEYIGENHIDAEYIKSLDLDGVERLFIRTNNSEFLKGSTFNKEYIALLPSAAEEIIKTDIQLLGVDAYSIGPFEPELGIKVHQIYLGGSPNQVAIEEVDLSNVAHGKYHLVSLPMKFENLEAAPIRVLFGKD